jgi:hypothetical protein
MSPCRTLAAALLFTAGSAALSPALAAIVSGTVNFTASYTGFLIPPPLTEVIGSFSITFDDAANVALTTSDTFLNSLNIALDSPIAFIYNQSLDVLRVGGISTGVGGVFADGFDFNLRIDSFSTAPSSNFFNATFGDGVLYGATPVVAVSFTPTQAVPEPQSLWLVGAGLAGLALPRAPSGGKRSGSAGLTRLPLCHTSRHHDGDEPGDHSSPALRIVARLDPLPRRPGNARTAMARHSLTDGKETTT